MKPPSFIKKAPSWVATLEMAKDWGMGPWRIVGGSKLLWIVRYEVLREIRIKYTR